MHHLFYYGEYSTEIYSTDIYGMEKRTSILFYLKHAFGVFQARDLVWQMSHTSHVSSTFVWSVELSHMIACV